MMSHAIVSDCNEDNMKKANNLFASLNVNQSENNDSLKMSILSYIKAVDKKNESVLSSRAHQHKQEYDLNKIVSITTDDSVHYVKRKRKSLICQEKIVDNSTENVEKPSLDFTDDLPQKKQPRISTESEKHIELNNLMTSDDIKAIDNLLECLKTYGNVAELEEDVVDPAEVTQTSLSTSINHPTEMTENVIEECVEPIGIKPPQQCKAKRIMHPNEYKKANSVVVNELRQSNEIIGKVINMPIAPFTIQIPPQCNVRIRIKHNKYYKDILPVVNVYSKSKHIKVISLPHKLKSIYNENEINASSFPNKSSLGP
ncbi:uncharacterized protein [Onthophagus taurus]|uniref:uncharacterized protein isoform X2 n=1 Tax=Onthophagus taurus TaxID=166361 RepID=UPI000C208A5E|nr:uncharacterized protein LOC111417577 isoform X2 [Onthophagus taurus]